MTSHRMQHVDPTADIAWVPGGVPRAYLYLLDGNTHVAAQGSAFERRLLDRGAFPVAMLSFDPPAAVQPAAESVLIHPLEIREAAGRFAGWPARN